MPSVDEILARKKQTGKLELPQSSEDHLVKIQPDTDIVLALDENGNELCRFLFEIEVENEKGEWESKRVTFRTPTLSKWKGFLVKFARLSAVMAQIAPNVEIPDMITNGDHNKLWNAAAKIFVQVSQIQKLITELFFDYLDARVESAMPSYKGFLRKRLESHAYASKRFFSENARIGDLQKILTAIMQVDQLVKKNATFTIQTMTTPPKSGVENIVPFSPLSQVSQSNA